MIQYTIYEYSSRRSKVRFRCGASKSLLPRQDPPPRLSGKPPAPPPRFTRPDEHPLIHRKVRGPRHHPIFEKSRIRPKTKASRGFGPSSQNHILGHPSGYHRREDKLAAGLKMLGNVAIYKSARIRRQRGATPSRTPVQQHFPPILQRKRIQPHPHSERFKLRPRIEASAPFHRPGGSGRPSRPSPAQ